MIVRRCVKCGTLWSKTTPICFLCGGALTEPCENPNVRITMPESNDKQNPEDQAMQDVLRDWWIDRAEAEVRLVAPKAVEYSSIDLIEYGRTLALVMGLNHAVTDEEATEIGIWGYLVGKVARWTGAIKEGRRVSEDTIFDINIYSKMALRNRDVGGWPFGPKEGH